MADHLPGAVLAAIHETPRSRRWSFVADGPPLLLVGVIFASLLAAWLAPGAPAFLAVMLGAAVILSAALESRRWGIHALGDGGAGELDPIALRQRLEAARIRRIQRARWR